MKKLLAFLLTSLIALFGFIPAAAAAGSPTVAMLTRSQPAIEYRMLDYEANWHDILDKTFLNKQFVENVNELTKDMFLDRWVLDEALQITLDKEYEDVEWTFMHKYSLDEHVVLIFTDASLNITHVLEGKTLENGNVLFDFSVFSNNEYPLNIYYMFVLFGLENPAVN